MRRANVLFLSLVLSACGSSYKEANTPLNHIQIIDRNGVNETISQKERLELFEAVNFLEAQPYQKVVRVFKRDKEGKVVSRLTTYHGNGEVFQYLDVLHGRANGVYKEWYDSGKLRILAGVMEGAGDLTPEAQATWVFDGESKVWDPKGTLIAELHYEKGKLEGEAFYYYPNGKLFKSIPYRNDKEEGESRIYDLEGNHVGGVSYCEGKREGRTFFLGDEKRPKKEEEYQNDLLMKGTYFDFSGKVTHEIVKGSGVKPTYEEGFLRKEEDFLKGKVEGKVTFYRKEGGLETTYTLVNGEKEGIETVYYEDNKPMLEIPWRADEIRGLVRTFYASGAIESEKEMQGGKKQGKLVVFYEGGELMLLEEYENDVLVNGKYFKRGEEFPLSRVIQGKGMAHIFDKEGNLVKKISYEKGVPSE